MTTITVNHTFGIGQYVWSATGSTITMHRVTGIWFGIDEDGHTEPSYTVFHRKDHSGEYASQLIRESELHASAPAAISTALVP